MTGQGLSVLFDGFWYVDGPPSQRHVVRELIASWSNRFPQDHLTVVVRRGRSADARRDLAHEVSIVETRVWPQAAVSAIVLPMLARRRNADAMLGQNFAGRSRAVNAIFLHDVLFVEHPEWFTKWERRYFALMPKLARNADIVFTSSGTEAARIGRLTSARRVVPVGLGISRELVDAEARRPVGLPGSVNSFFLTVGRLNVRKNLTGTIRGFADAGAINAECPLVVVGSRNGREERLPDALAPLVASGAVLFLGHIGDSELKWLYQRCELFAFLSRGEGYGMPPVEARALGADVLCSDLPVFRELLDAGATFVDPDDRQGVAAAIRNRVASSDRVGTSKATATRWNDVVMRLRTELVKAG